LQTFAARRRNPSPAASPIKRASIRTRQTHGAVIALRLNAHLQHHAPTKMNPPILSQKHAAQEIERILRSFGCNANVEQQEVVVREDKVMLGPLGANLADQLWDFIFPRAPSAIYYHFTKMDGFQGIISSERLRLYNLHKRYDDDEFRAFCRDHGLEGFLDESAKRPSGDIHEQLMDNLFYVSLVDHGQRDSTHHWEVFGAGRTGVRLGFKIEADHYSDFLTVSYQSPDRSPMFFALQDAFASLGRDFIVLGISRMGAYYVLQKFRKEHEYRLLVHKPQDSKQFEFVVTPEGTGHVKFIECEMGGRTCSKFAVTLVEVTSGKFCDHSTVEAVVRTSRSFSKVPVTTA